jgi:catechol 2,3-dioxygenase-like lactoylglutathione lyase family enzyme
MLHHVSVGVRSVERAALFYDAVLGALGCRRVMEFLPYAIGYGEAHPTFWVQLPHNQQPASPGNGVHVGFIARSKDAVHRFHAAALAHGGRDDGAPGPRPDYGPDYYGAFVYDLDGNKLEATLTPLPPVLAMTKANKMAKAKVVMHPKKKARKKAAPKKKVAKRKAKKR